MTLEEIKKYELEFKERPLHSCSLGCKCSHHSDQDGMFSHCLGDCCTHPKNCEMCKKKGF